MANLARDEAAADAYDAVPSPAVSVDELMADERFAPPPGLAREKADDYGQHPEAP